MAKVIYLLHLQKTNPFLTVMKPETCKTLYHSSIIGELVGVVLYLCNFFGPHQPKATDISLFIVGFFAIAQIILLFNRKKWDKQDTDQETN